MNTADWIPILLFVLFLWLVHEIGPWIRSHVNLPPDPDWDEHYDLDDPDHR